MRNDEKVTGLIVHPDGHGRNRLKQAVLAVNNYRKVFPGKSPRDVLPILEDKDSDLLVVFISYELSPEEISKFISKAKETASGIDSAYVLLLQPDKQDASTIAESLMDGIDSFLLEPYSVDALVEITELAKVVKAKRRQARQEGAMQLLMDDTISKIDAIAQNQAKGQGPGQELRGLRKSGQSIQTLDQEMLPTYFQVMFTSFQKATVLKQVVGGDMNEERSKAALNRIKEKLRERDVELVEEQKPKEKKTVMGYEKSIV